MMTDCSQHSSKGSLRLEPLSRLLWMAPPSSLRLHLCAAGLTALLLASASMARDTESLGKPAVSVRYAEARQATGEDRLRTMGKVVASRSTVVASEVAGLIESLSVRPGAQVQKGQELARLRARPLELRLEAAVGELQEATARLGSCELRLERQQTLAASEVVSPQVVDDAVYESQAAEGLVARLSAEVARLRDDLEHGVLRAPFDGAVVEQRTQIGQWVSVGDSVVEIVSLDRLEVLLDIPEGHYGDVKPGAPVTIRSEAGGGQAIAARVRAVVPQASGRAHTFPGYVSLPKDTGLAVGMLVQGEVLLGTSKPAVWVPKDALLGRGTSRAIFVMSSESSSVHRVEVTLGRIDGDWQEVEANGEASIHPGDSVITHGNEQLQEGERVRAVRQDYPIR